VKILLAILIFTIISQVTSTPINKQATVAQITEPKVIATPASVKEDTPVVIQEQTVTPIVTAAKPACDAYDALLIENFGANQLNIAKAIMRAESGCRHDAVGDNHITYAQNGTTYGMSCGLFQIRFLPGRPNCEQMKNPSENIAYAGQLFRSQGFRPWSAFLNGSFRKFL
jgi:hypothetical protein